MTDNFAVSVCASTVLLFNVEANDRLERVRRVLAVKTKKETDQTNKQTHTRKIRRYAIWQSFAYFFPLKILSNSTGRNAYQLWHSSRNRVEIEVQVVFTSSKEPLCDLAHAGASVRLMGCGFFLGPSFCVCLVSKNGSKCAVVSSLHVSMAARR